MLWGAVAGNTALEIRQLEGGRVRMTGAFPYGMTAELAEGRREVIAGRAFASRLESGEDIHFLVGHDYEKPLASRSAGTLELVDSDEALSFAATISPDTTWARDFLAAHRACLIRGLSPGFRVLPKGERIVRESDGIRRTIEAAELFELSAVTRPAYSQAQIEARNWKAQTASRARPPIVEVWRR